MMFTVIQIEESVCGSSKMKFLKSFEDLDEAMKYALIHKAIQYYSTNTTDESEQEYLTKIRRIRDMSTEKLHSEFTFNKDGDGDGDKDKDEDKDDCYGRSLTISSSYYLLNHGDSDIEWYDRYCYLFHYHICLNEQ